MMICSQPKVVRGTAQSKVSETLAPISTPKGQDNIYRAMGQVFCDGSGVNFTSARALGQMKILRLIAQGQPKFSNVRQWGYREILLEIFRKFDPLHFIWTPPLLSRSSYNLLLLRSTFGNIN